MKDLRSSIIQKLKNSGIEKQTLSFCEKLLKWYEEGGTDYTLEKIRGIIKEYKEVKEEIKAIKEVLPKIKKRKRKRR